MLNSYDLEELHEVQDKKMEVKNDKLLPRNPSASRESEAPYQEKHDT